MILGRVISVTGQAGTGKTTWLIDKAAELVPVLIKHEHQRLLAITRMHGSRRRLQLRLNESRQDIPSLVTTIDGFALSLLNRWRRSLGYTKCVLATDGVCSSDETVFGVEVSFGDILANSTKLLESQTVKSTIGQTFPVIMIDEFQDCHGQLLDFVAALSECSTILVASDEFQSLDTNIVGCPAEEWTNDIEAGACEHTQLQICHRTSVQPILKASGCLRQNKPSTVETVPVYACPAHGPAAYKILEALVYHSREWQGSTALICPSHDAFVNQVLDSLSSQMKKKNYTPFPWFHESAAHDERKQLQEGLRLDVNDSEAAVWVPPTEGLSASALQVVSRTQRFTRLKGIDQIPNSIVIRHIDKVVHERRAYSGYSAKRIITTVHGAKNREFDNVIVLWPYTVKSDEDQRRRLLYNAITRSRQNCMVLARGTLERVQTDSVLALLGPPKNAFGTRGSGKPSAKRQRG